MLSSKKEFLFLILHNISQNQLDYLIIQLIVDTAYESFAYISSIYNLNYFRCDYLLSFLAKFAGIVKSPSFSGNLVGTA